MDKENIKLAWSVNNDRHSSGEKLHAGKWHIGGVYYDGGKSTHDPMKWAAACALPGIKPLLQHYGTKDEAKARVERAVALWFDGLQPQVEATQQEGATG